MVDTVEIADIRLAPLEAKQMTQPMVHSGNAWYEATLKLKNPSAVTLYAISSVRRMTYDESRRVLVFELSDHNRGDLDRLVGLPLPPSIEAIAPGAEATVTFRLSSPVVFLEQSSAGQDRPRSIRVPEDVQVIECIVASDATPPPQDKNLASAELPPDTRSWGYTSQRSLRLD